jgi:hypothetical protein
METGFNDWRICSSAGTRAAKVEGARNVRNNPESTTISDVVTPK